MSPPQSVRLSDPYLAEFFGVRGSHSSFTSPDDAVAALATAARCVSLISEGLSALPLNVYRLLGDGGREVAENHQLHRILNDAANDHMSAFELRELLYRDLAMQGNAYARIVRDSAGRVRELHYMPCRMVGVERLRNGRLRYRYTDPNPAVGTQVLLAEEVAHLRYSSKDGVLGLSPLAWAQGAVSLAMSQSELAETQAQRGFVSDMAFETDAAFQGDLADTAFQRLKQQLSERLRRMSRDPEALLLEAGLKAKPLATPGREAQFHEARVLGLEDVARIYGVPLSVVGLGKNSSYGSLTEESRALRQNCFSPWARRGEAQLALALLTAEGRRQYTIEHDLSGLERGDLKARLEAYEIGIRSEIWSPNECRVWEGQNKRPGGDQYRNPSMSQPKGDDDESGSSQAA
ncbi:phage portal protein [Microvirga aerophila]|nr:phage portal protein [Microvirga aerophila]